MSVSVIIPSRLEKAEDGTFLCERAIAFVQAQTQLPTEIILALDEGAEYVPSLQEKYPTIRPVYWMGRGHPGPTSQRQGSAREKPKRVRGLGSALRSHPVVDCACLARLFRSCTVFTTSAVAEKCYIISGSCRSRHQCCGLVVAEHTSNTL